MESSTAPAQRYGGFDLSAWLRDRDVAIAAERPWQGGVFYNLTQFPISDAHGAGVYAIECVNGANNADCKHESYGGGAQQWGGGPQPHQAGVRRPRETVPGAREGRPVMLGATERLESSTRRGMPRI